MDDLDFVDPSKVIIVTTGSQGEYSSTLNLSSLNLSSKLFLKRDDLLLYSAKIIPGYTNLNIRESKKSR